MRRTALGPWSVAAPADAALRSAAAPAHRSPRQGLARPRPILPRRSPRPLHPRDQRPPGGMPHARLRSVRTFPVPEIDEQSPRGAADTCWPSKTTSPSCMPTYSATSPACTGGVIHDRSETVEWGHGQLEWCTCTIMSGANGLRDLFDPDYCGTALGYAVSVVAERTVRSHTARSVRHYVSPTCPWQPEPPAWSIWCAATGECPPGAGTACTGCCTTHPRRPLPPAHDGGPQPRPTRADHDSVTTLSTPWGSIGIWTRTTRGSGNHGNLDPHCQTGLMLCRLSRTQSC